MILNVMRYRSDGRPDEHITSIHVEVFPNDQLSFAEEYGGDYVRVQEEDVMDETDYQMRMRILRECPTKL